MSYTVDAVATTRTCLAYPPLFISGRLVDLASGAIFGLGTRVCFPPTLLDHLLSH